MDRRRQIRDADAGFQILIVGRVYEQEGHSGGSGSALIALGVPHHPGLPEVNPLLLGPAQDQARLGFPALAGVLVIMAAGQDRVYRRLVPQAAVEAGEQIGGEVATADFGLVRRHDNCKTGAADFRDGRSGAGENGEVLPAQRGVRDAPTNHRADEHTVAVEKNAWRSEERRVGKECRL